MSPVRIDWTRPDGTREHSTVNTLDEAGREKRRLERLGCRWVRILTDPNLLAAPRTRSAR